MATVDTEVRELRHLVGGVWVSGDGGTFDDRDPFTGETVARVAAATREDARRAVEAASAAFPDWWHAPPAPKQANFLKAADLLEGRRDDVVSWLARETGCTFGFAMFQIG